MSQSCAFRPAVGVGLISTLAATFCAGCGVPFSQSLYTPEIAAVDEGLPGTWVWEDDRNRIEVRVDAAGDQGEAGAFTSFFRIEQDDEQVAEYEVDVRLVRLGGRTFVDLSLGDDHRSSLAETIGLLALPVHQIYRVDRDGDELSVRTLDYERLRDLIEAGLVPLTHTMVTIRGEGTILITSETAALQAFFEGAEDEAFDDPIVFTRAPGG